MFPHLMRKCYVFKKKAAFKSCSQESPSSLPAYTNYTNYTACYCSKIREMLRICLWFAPLFLSLLWFIIFWTNEAPFRSKVQHLRPSCLGPCSYRCVGRSRLPISVSFPGYRLLSSFKTISKLCARCYFTLVMWCTRCMVTVTPPSSHWTLVNDDYNCSSVAVNETMKGSEQEHFLDSNSLMLCR